MVAQKNLEALSPEKQAAVRDYVENTTKPGLIIDGQHRVFGAKNVNAFEVMLPIILLPNLSPAEQAFHFYVLNNTAKPLNRTQLRTIVSTSLSNGEIDTLYKRFKQVGVTTQTADLTYRLNTDDASPFRGLVNMGLGGVGVITENVAYQVASKFFNPAPKYKLLIDGVAAWNDADSKEFRLKCFYSMWGAIKKRYANAWNMAASGNANRQILQKVNLLVLQEYILDTLTNEMPKRAAKGQGSPLADPDELAAEVGYALTFVDEEFYTRPWTITGLDTSSGHQVFRGELEKALRNQSKNLGYQRLFKAQ